MKISLLFQYLECFNSKIGCDRTIYSPKFFIEKFGYPSKITFYIEATHDTTTINGSTATPEYPSNYIWYDMIMNYEPLDLIVAYYRAGFINQSENVICPLTDPFETIQIWIGKDPEHPPYEGVPLR